MARNLFILVQLLGPCLLLAEPTAEQLEARLATIQGHEKLELLVELLELYAEEKPRRTISRSAEFFELLRQAPDDQLELSALNTLTSAHLRLADYHEAELHGTRAEKLARRRGDKSALALALSHLGELKRYESAHLRSREYLFEAIELYEELGDSSGLGEALKDIGITYRLISDFPTAMNYYFRALEAFGDAGDRSGIAQVLNSLGIAYTKIEQYNKAKEALLKALRIQEELGNQRSVTMILNNLGFAYLGMERPQEALVHYRRAMEMKKELGDERGMSFSLNGLGRAHIQRGELDLALRYFDQSLQIKEKFGDKKGMAALMLEKASIDMEKDELDKVVSGLKRALAIATEVNAREFMSSSHFALSDYYAKVGRHAEALESFRKYKAINDQLFNEQNSKNIAEIQARYESEQKARQIEILEQQQAIDALELSRQRTTSRNLVGGLMLACLLGLLALSWYRSRAKAARERARQEERERYIANLEVKNAEVRAKNAEVQAKNAEMERFTYAVSHDLRTPLVTIRGFLGLLKKDMARDKMGQVTQDIASIDDAAKKMSQLLDEMLELSRIGRVISTPKQVSLTEVAREAVSLVAGPIAQRRVEVEIAPDLPVVLADHPRLREVLQNLVENAVKFIGDQPHPLIEIGCRAEETASPDADTVVFVRDNGIGIEPKYHDLIFGLFDRLETATEGTGIGLALVKRIVEVHGGKIWVESEGQGNGSTFCFTLP